jgi:hypothetical protein
VINEKVHEDDSSAAKTPLAIYYVQSIGCVLQTAKSQHVCQLSVNDFWSCWSGNYKVMWLMLYIVKGFAAVIGNRKCNKLPIPSGE